MITIEEKKQQKIEVNKKMIGKKVLVSPPKGDPYFGYVIDADEDTVTVKNGDQCEQVDLFDIR